MAIHKISHRFYSDKHVDWPCPVCGQKTLEIMQDSFVEEESLGTRKAQNEDWFDYDMSESYFSCMAKCSRAKCGEAVACVGQAGWDRDYQPEEMADEYYQWYKPLCFVPSLNVFQIPENCPDEVSGPLKAAFSIFLMQQGAAANLIRIAVENILTSMGIPTQNDKGKTIRLHHRIEKIPEEGSKLAQNLLAIKFLGNAGSHTFDEVRIKDIEGAFEIMDYVVSELYSDREKTIETIRKSLNKKFGNMQ